MTSPVTSYLDVLNREDRFTFRMFVLLGLLLVLIGRIQEVFLFLAPLRLAIVFYSLSLLVIIGLLREGRFQVFGMEAREMKFLLGFYGAGVLSILFSSYTMASLDFMAKTMLLNVLLFVLVVNIVRSAGDLRRTLWVMIMIVLLLAIPAILGSQEGRWTVEGSSYDPNDTALLIVVTLPLILGLIPQSGGFIKKLILLASIPVLLLALVKTESRSGYLGLVVVLGFFLFHVRSLSAPKKAGIAVILAITITLLTPESLYKRMSVIGTDEDYNVTAVAGRKQIWERSLQLIARNPVFGVGPGCFRTASGFEFSEEVGGISWRMTAHNSYILVATEMGLVGLGFYLAFLLKGMLHMRRIRIDARENPAIEEGYWFALSLQSSLVGFMVCAFFLSFSYSSLSYFLVALGVAHQRILAERTGYQPQGAPSPEQESPLIAPPYASGPR